jgi:hypothetical protein
MCLNISVDSLHFLKPSKVCVCVCVCWLNTRIRMLPIFMYVYVLCVLCKVGEAIIIRSQVNRAFEHYMEVGILVEVEDLLVCR